MTVKLNRAATGPLVEQVPWSIPASPHPLRRWTCTSPLYVPGHHRNLSTGRSTTLTRRPLGAYETTADSSCSQSRRRMGLSVVTRNQRSAESFLSTTKLTVNFVRGVPSRGVTETRTAADAAVLVTRSPTRTLIERVKNTGYSEARGSGAVGAPGYLKYSRASPRGARDLRAVARRAPAGAVPAAQAVPRDSPLAGEL